MYVDSFGRGAGLVIPNFDILKVSGGLNSVIEAMCYLLDNQFQILM